MRHLAIVAIAIALCITSCTSEAPTDIAAFDVAGAREGVTPLDDRAPAPVGALPAFVVRSYADPAAFDELLAEAQAQAGDNQLIITADVNGCVLLSLWALPEPDGVRVGYEFDSSIDCATAIDYRALFIVDQTGSTAAGEWNYVTAPPVRLQPQPPT